LLRLYPRRYREQFGAEMLAVFEQSLADSHGSRFVFALREIGGLLSGAFLERMSSPRLLNTPVANDLPDELGEAQRRVDSLRDRMTQAIAAHDFVNARRYSERDHQERARQKVLRERHGLSD